MGVKRLARMSTGGRITVPKAVRDAANIHAGDNLLVLEIDENQALAVRADRELTDEELDELARKVRASASIPN